jgi:hypothetical protein
MASGELRVGRFRCEEELEAARVGGGALNAPLSGEGKGRERRGRQRDRRCCGHGEGWGGRRWKTHLTGGSHLSARGREGNREGFCWAEREYWAVGGKMGRRKKKKKRRERGGLIF